MQQATLIFLLNSQNQLLLGMKKRGFGVNKRNGFGGKPHGDESIVETAIRELQEESGVQVALENVSYHGVLHFSFENKPEREQDVHVFSSFYDGGFEESEEMLPKRRDIDNIPYDQMWDADKIRLPKLINGEKFEMSFRFSTEGKLLN